ncbi:hypothetical protein QWI49_07255 [Acinetobacter nosocomialis]|uniref:hypothetical protein n=1 Tax=Acinetobacter nosocomialis TaxID=106654 RepID=UPI00274202B0|nr:hypothetical protein [Acinetobacter nosocomialis]MDP7774954.1 hypothetical protein [Acinetobacter nosocomialis]
MSKKIAKGKKAEFLKLYSELRREASIKECTLLSDMNNPCEGKIVNAHSIQRGKILQSIAENGEVFELAFEIYDDFEPTIQFKNVGIKKFSTFSGFCQKHDKTIFQPIEDRPFENSPEQKMIYAYRAITKELHTKKESRRLNSISTKNVIQSIQLIQDINDLKRLSDFTYSKLENNQFDELIHYSYVLDNFYPIACNSIFIPYFDMSGKKVFSKSEYEEIQNSSLPVERSPFIILNIFPEQDKTYILISHINSRCNDFEFLKELFDKSVNDFTLAISQIMLTYCENVAFGPKYIKSKFNIEERGVIRKFFEETMLDRINYHSNEINLFR